MGRMEGETFLYLGFRQRVFPADRCRRHSPVPRGSGYRLHPDTGPADHGCRPAGRAAPIGNPGKRRIIQVLAQLPDFLGHGPEDELVERDPLAIGPLFRFFF